MKMAKEFDIIVTFDGIEATILETYESEPRYYAQRTDDDELISIRSDQIKDIIYNATA